MKVATLVAVATAALFHHAAAKELQPTDEFLELYQSGAKHKEIMALKHVCRQLSPFMLTTVRYAFADTFHRLVGTLRLPAVR